ncbi:hypothetical protein LZ518_10555 [Sphingomonas sp. RB56-2]|uniref:Uncharacterized protein n=1 Tax=Sphingomonas brevis TaxID=2908206 RepID=A0ABT0SB20_9SPHN|nr:hypothetical protein [Sphingomonas brevis]MCL6741572.1 hypothetical protein [Sphingomonas brevis]
MNNKETTSALFTALVGLGSSAALAALALGSEHPYRAALLILGSAFCLAGLIGLVLPLFLSSKAVTAHVPDAASPTPPAPLAPTHLRLSDFALASLGKDVSLPDRITPAFLFAQCTGKTDIQCEGAVAVYVGKRLRVSGPILAASRVGASTTVTIHPVLGVDGRQDIYMVFEQDHEEISVMQVGDVLTATGRITQLNSSGMKLADCRLVS